MTLKDFIEKYDKPNAVVLLEGKRTVQEEDRERLIQLGALLAKKTKNITFRSGNAKGADYYFSFGVASVSSARLQVITPYNNHRQKENKAYETISLDNINIAAEPEVVYQSKAKKNMAKLVDQYAEGKRDRYSMKAAYILRDTVKAIGAENLQPAVLGIFYDDLSHPGEGGTGHTMAVCGLNNIPVIDQSIWFTWLDNQAEQYNL